MSSHQQVLPGAPTRGQNTPGVAVRPPQAPLEGKAWTADPWPALLWPRVGRVLPGPLGHLRPAAPCPTQEGLCHSQLLFLEATHSLSPLPAQVPLSALPQALADLCSPAPTGHTWGKWQLCTPRPGRQRSADRQLPAGWPAQRRWQERWVARGCTLELTFVPQILVWPLTPFLPLGSLLGSHSGHGQHAFSTGSLGPDPLPGLSTSRVLTDPSSPSSDVNSV